jgi:hypothetical protein
MSDPTEIVSSVAGYGAAVAAALIGIAAYLPKLLNSIKGDRVEGNVLDRLIAHERRMNEMDKTIHRQQIKVTRLLVLVIQLEGMLEASGVKMSESMRQEISELKHEFDNSED